MMTESLSKIFTDEVVQYLPDARVLRDGMLSCDCRGNWWFHNEGSEIIVCKEGDKRHMGHYHAWVSDDMLELPGVDFEYIPDLSDDWENTLICTKYLEKLQKSARNKSEEFWAKKKQETAA